MKRVSTHILDLARGKPATGVPVQLAVQESSGEWRVIASSKTDGDGRCPQLLASEDSRPGFYRLTFDTASYFDSLRIDALYPMVEVTFQVREGDAHFHIPLLLSPNGYTTYRGT